MLSPLTSFAATAKTTAAPAVKTSTDESLSEDVLLEILDNSTSSPAMMDRGGGGYGIIAPGYGNGVTVDSTITKEVTPDFIALNAYCDSGKKASRETARDALNQLYNDIKAIVGSDGRVRKMGSPSIYPYYGPMGEETDSYTANMSVFVRITKQSSALRISDAIENKGCSVNWDVRLIDTQSFELDQIDTLISRLNKRKAVFEKLLGKRLTNVVGASLSTWVDGYSTYDPETNKVDATTTLSVTYQLSGRTTISNPRLLPVERATPAAAPKG